MRIRQDSLKGNEGLSIIMRNISQTERTLTLELKMRMDESGKFSKVYVWKRPGRSSIVRKMWADRHGPALTSPMQPDMDMIVFWEGKVIGVEVKYFQRTGRRLGTSFYEGIGQALALLKWGFDHVALWQIFDETTTDEEIVSYGTNTWIYLREAPERGGLGLPLEFTPMKVSTKNNEHEFQIVHLKYVGGLHIVFLGRPLYDPKFRFSVTRKNPLMERPLVKLQREILLEWLETQPC